MLARERMLSQRILWLCGAVWCLKSVEIMLLAASSQECSDSFFVPDLGFWGQAWDSLRFSSFES